MERNLLIKLAKVIFNLLQLLLGILKENQDFLKLILATRLKTKR